MCVCVKALMILLKIFHPVVLSVMELMALIHLTADHFHHFFHPFFTVDCSHLYLRLFHSSSFMYHFVVVFLFSPSQNNVPFFKYSHPSPCVDHRKHFFFLVHPLCYLDTTSISGQYFYVILFCITVSMSFASCMTHPSDSDIHTCLRHQ